jgi:hypothetical protein
MYGKLFAQMYDGTLGTKGPWQALVTFQQLIILADQYGDVDMTAEAIARRTTIPLDVVNIGLAELVKPDPHSRTPDEDGRRIVPLAENRDWGWHIVNHDIYRKIRSQEERREYMRLYQRHRRAAVNKNVNTSTSGKQSQPIAVSRKQEAESRKQDTSLFDAVWQAYPKRAGGNPRAAAEKAYAARLRDGATPDSLLAGTRRYAAFIRATGKEGTEYVKQAASFFGPDGHWAEPWDAPAPAGTRKAAATTTLLQDWVANG